MGEDPIAQVHRGQYGCRSRNPKSLEANMGVDPVTPKSLVANMGVDPIAQVPRGKFW